MPFPEVIGLVGHSGGGIFAGDEAPIPDDSTELNFEPSGNKDKEIAAHTLDR